MLENSHDEIYGTIKLTFRGDGAALVDHCREATGSNANGDEQASADENPFLRKAHQEIEKEKTDLGFIEIGARAG